MYVSGKHCLLKMLLLNPDRCMIPYLGSVITERCWAVDVLCTAEGAGRSYELIQLDAVLICIISSVGRKVLGKPVKPITLITTEVTANDNEERWWTNLAGVLLM